MFVTVNRLPRPEIGSGTRVRVSLPGPGRITKRHGTGDWGWPRLIATRQNAYLGISRPCFLLHRKEIILYHSVLPKSKIGCKNSGVFTPKFGIFARHYYAQENYVLLEAFAHSEQILLLIRTSSEKLYVSPQKRGSA